MYGESSSVEECDGLGFEDAFADILGKVESLDQRMLSLDERLLAVPTRR